MRSVNGRTPGPQARPEALEIVFVEAEVVADLVLHRDLDLLDQLRVRAAHLLEVLLEEDHAVDVARLRGDGGLGARHADEEPEDLRRDVLALDQLLVGEVADQHGHVLDVLADRARQVAQRLGRDALEDRRRPRRSARA